MGHKEELLTRMLALDAKSRSLSRTSRTAPRKPGLSERLALMEGIVELAPAGIAIAYGSDCREIRANSELRALLGVRSDRNVSKSSRGASQLPFRVMQDGVEIPAEDLPMQRAAREGIAIYRRFEIHRNDRTVVVLDGAARPWLSKNGVPQGSIGAFFDATDTRNEFARLQAALSQSQFYGHLIRVCASCRKIADQENSWHEFEVYLSRECDARFTHGLCPECFQRAMKTLPNQ